MTIHRHLDYPQDTPPAELGLAAIDDILDRGDLADWAPLARAVADEPWGSLAETILHLCTAHAMYGTSPLWTAYIADCRDRQLRAEDGTARPGSAAPLRALAPLWLGASLVGCK